MSLSLNIFEIIFLTNYAKLKNFFPHEKSLFSSLVSEFTLNNLYYITYFRNIIFCRAIFVLRYTLRVIPYRSHFQLMIIKLTRSSKIDCI